MTKRSSRKSSRSSSRDSRDTSSSSSSSTRPKSNVGLYIGIFLLFVGIGLSSGGIFIYVKKVRNNQSASSKLKDGSLAMIGVGVLLVVVSIVVLILSIMSRSKRSKT